MLCDRTRIWVKFWTIFLVVSTPKFFKIKNLQIQPLVDLQCAQCEFVITFYKVVVNCVEFRIGYLSVIFYLSLIIFHWMIVIVFFVTIEYWKFNKFFSKNFSRKRIPRNSLTNYFDNFCDYSLEWNINCHCIVQRQPLAKKEKYWNTPQFLLHSSVYCAHFITGRIENSHTYFLYYTNCFTVIEN